MKIQIEPSRLQGTLSVPASKSIAHRMLICAGLAEGVSVVERVSFSKDIEATIHAMEALGASFQIAGSTITVTGIGNHTAVSEFHVVKAVLLCGFSFRLQQHSVFRQPFLERADCRSVRSQLMSGNFLKREFILTIRTLCRFP